MSVRSKHLKLVGVAGAAALTVGALAAPALAANSTAHAAYTCSVPAPFPPATPTADYSVAPAPATMAVGQPLATTATFTLDAGTTALAAGLGWSKFNGTITTKPSASQAGLSLKFPKTTLGNGTAGSTVANATGSTLAGSAVVNSFTFVLGDLGDVKLNGYDSGGNFVGSVEFPTSGSFGKCVNDAGTTHLKNGAADVVTKIVKDTTTSKVKAAYSAKKNIAKGTAVVKSKYGTKATGKVKFTLKKGTHKIKTITSKLNKKGIAKAAFKGVKAKGKYSITGKYTGSATLKGSSGKARFKVA
jgi:hypothetical protein